MEFNPYSLEDFQDFLLRATEISSSADEYIAGRKILLEQNDVEQISIPVVVDRIANILFEELDTLGISFNLPDGEMVGDLHRASIVLGLRQKFEGSALGEILKSCPKTVEHIKASAREIAEDGVGSEDFVNRLVRWLKDEIPGSVVFELLDQESDLFASSQVFVNHVKAVVERIEGQLVDPSPVLFEDKVAVIKEISEREQAWIAALKQIQSKHRPFGPGTFHTYIGVYDRGVIEGVHIAHGLVNYKRMVNEFGRYCVNRLEAYYCDCGKDKFSIEHAALVAATLKCEHDEDKRNEILHNATTVYGLNLEFASKIKKLLE